MRFCSANIFRCTHAYVSERIMASRLQGLQGRNRARGKQQKSYEREQVFPSLDCKFAQNERCNIALKSIYSLKMPFGNDYLLC